ncbi:hypothetical protein D3C72_2128320 [compost metagenome]
MPISTRRRVSNSERISSSLGNDTDAPLLGSVVTNPSASSCLSAARTDVRLTLNSSASEASPSFIPGRNERLLIAS